MTPIEAAPCPAGTYTDTTGSEACTSCGHGATSAEGSTAVRDCFCPVGYTGDASGGGNCIFSACPAGFTGDEESGCTAIPLLAFGDRHVCAQNATLALKCWGENGFGMLGDGTTTDRNSPVVSSGPCLAFFLSRVTRLQLRSTSRLSTTERVADGASSMREQVDVVNLGGATVAVAAGGSHSCAILVRRVSPVKGQGVGNRVRSLGDA